MTVRDEIAAKLEQFKRYERATFDQGRSPRDIALTLEGGVEILTLMGRLADALADAHGEHTHTYKVGGYDKQTTGPH